MKKIKCFATIVLIATMLTMQTGCPQPSSPEPKTEIVSVWKSELGQTLTLYSDSTFFLDEGNTVAEMGMDGTASGTYENNGKKYSFHIKEATGTINTFIAPSLDMKDVYFVLNIDGDTATVGNPTVLGLMLNYNQKLTKDGSANTGDDNGNPNDDNTGDNENGDSTGTEKEIVSVWKSELDQTLTLYSDNTFFLDEGDTVAGMGMDGTASGTYENDGKKYSFHIKEATGTINTFIAPYLEIKDVYFVLNIDGDTATVGNPTVIGLMLDYNQKLTKNGSANTGDDNGNENPNDDNTGNNEKPDDGSGESTSGNTESIKGDIEVATSTLSGYKTFTVQGKHNSYLWKVDNKTISESDETYTVSGATFTINIKKLSIGIHSVMVIVDGKYSAEFSVRIADYRVTVAEFSILFASLEPNTADTPYTISITGKISDSELVNIASLMKEKSNCYIDLDLLETTGMTYIGGWTFSGCSSLVAISIPDSVISINDSPSSFNSCSSLASVTVAENNNYYSSEDGVLFNKNKSRLIAYPPASDNYDYIIPNSVIIIENDAFRFCSNLANVTIPDSVISIGEDAFHFCSSLASFTVADNNICYSSESGVLFNKDKSSLIAYPSARVDDDYTIPDSVTYIGDYAFHDCSSLASVTIPDGVTYIGWNAFSGCSSLAAVTIPDSVTYIGRNTFDNCTSLASVTFSDTTNWYADNPYNSTDTTTVIDVTDPSTNATNLKSYGAAWIGKYLYKKTTSGN